MSLLIPQNTVDVFRQFNDISIDLYGIDCQIYNPINMDSVDRNSAYTMDLGFSYQKKETKVFIVWSASTRQLHRLGVFTEDEIPIISYFKSLDGVIVGSYFVLNPQFIPNQYKTTEFEIVDVIAKNMLDSVVIKAYKVAARRVK